MKNIRNYVTHCDIPNFINCLYAFLLNGEKGSRHIWDDGLRYHGFAVLGRFVCTKTENGKQLAIFDSETEDPIIIVSLGVRKSKHTLSTEFFPEILLNSEEHAYIFDIVVGNALALLNICDCEVVNGQTVAEGV